MTKLRMLMQKKSSVKLKIIKKCLFCLDSFKGKSYQLYCSITCQQKAIYMRSRNSYKNSKNTLPEIACDICGKMFVPRRANCRRCSPACRLTYRRNYTEDRNQDRARVYREKHPPKPCAVCGDSFQGSESRKTCCRSCAHEYNTYSEIKKRKTRPKQFVPKNWPLPLQEPIEVSPVNWPPERDAIKKAINEFVAKGGVIRKYNESPETDLLEENPSFQNESQEAEDQLFGTARAW